MDYSQKYTIKKHGGLGSGGNGEVKKAICIDSGEAVALKSLTREAMEDQEKRERFEDEVRTMLQAEKTIKGIIPILDYSIEDGWYVMPIAEKIDKHIEGVDDAVKGVLEIAETLVDLHKQGLSHRDIKPDNILYYDGRWVLCDFGLVDIPDNPHNLTKNSKRIGAVRTLAPEMTRYAKSADGRKADVYSLAKTLWILLTRTKDSFEGRYVVTDKSMSLHQYDHLKETHLVEIDELLNAATQNFPDDRPSMKDFVKKLKKWKEVKDNNWKRAESNWNFVKSFLFQGNTPQRSCWMNPADILNVLNVISLLPIDCHLFFPNRGWMEFKRAEPARTEASCLDIYTPMAIYRVKLGQLLFESFNLASMDYFLLEAEPLDVKVGTEVDEWSEQVVEDANGQLVSAVDAMYGVYNYDTGEKLPKGSKILVRCLKGKFLMILKQGPYNMISQLDDGRHSNCSNDQLREYVGNLEKVFALNGLMEKEKWKKLLDYYVDSCPFKPKIELPDATDLFKEDSNFVKDNMGTFDFSPVIDNNANTLAGKAKYRYILHLSIKEDIYDSILTNTAYYLCKDGYIKMAAPDSKEIFEATDRETALRILKDLLDVLDACCEGIVQKMDKPYFTIEILKVGNPSYLFSKEEIKKLMEEADDRHDNTLVIDENGKAKLLAKRKDAEVYPVVHPTWCERNLCVGKYSNLSELDSAYHYCLGKWFDYLKEGVGQSKDDCQRHHEKDDELEAMIRSITDKK